MEINKTINKDNPSLVLCFAGWSASPDLFRGLRISDGTDLWICYDFRNLAFNEDLTHYKQIHLVAWSLGVWVADHLFHGRHTFTTATAINGTARPMDDQDGIPEAIFKGTLANITEEGMGRFNRRMCGDRDTLAAYSGIPARPLNEIREELQCLHDQIRSSRDLPKGTDAPCLWNRAIIGTADKIFPVGNLRHYWQGRAAVTEIAAPHFPFLHYQTWNELWN